MESGIGIFLGFLVVSLAYVWFKHKPKTDIIHPSQPTSPPGPNPHGKVFLSMSDRKNLHLRQIRRGGRASTIERKNYDDNALFVGALWLAMMYDEKHHADAEMIDSPFSEMDVNYSSYERAPEMAPVGEEVSVVSTNRRYDDGPSWDSSSDDSKRSSGSFSSSSSDSSGSFD